MDFAAGTTTTFAGMLDDSRSTVHQKCHSPDLVIDAVDELYFYMELLLSSIHPIITCTILLKQSKE